MPLPPPLALSSAVTPRVAHERLDAADVADGVVTLDRSSSNTLLACEQHVQLKNVQHNTEGTLRTYACTCIDCVISKVANTLLNNKHANFHELTFVQHLINHHWVEGYASASARRRVERRCRTRRRSWQCQPETRSTTATLYKFALSYMFLPLSGHNRTQPPPPAPIAFTWMP